MASSIAYAYWGSIDFPFMVVGVVSDGAQYTFLVCNYKDVTLFKYLQVFQLNTLDFSVQSQVKNFLWRTEMTLFDNHRKFNPAPLEQLAQIISFILDQQKRGMLKHNLDVKLQSRKKGKVEKR